MMYDLKHKLDCQQILRLKRGNDVFTARHSKDLNQYILERNGKLNAQKVNNVQSL